MSKQPHYTSILSIEIFWHVLTYLRRLLDIDLHSYRGMNSGRAIGNSTFHPKWHFIFWHFTLGDICSHVTFHANRIVFQIQNEFMYTFCYTWKLFSMLCSLNLPDFFIHSFIYIYGKMKCHRVKCRKEEMSPWKKCLISYNHDVSFYQWHQKNIFSDHFWLFFSILKKNPANCQVANLSLLWKTPLFLFQPSFLLWVLFSSREIPH